MKAKIMSILFTKCISALFIIMCVIIHCTLFSFSDWLKAYKLLSMISCRCPCYFLAKTVICKGH